MNEQDERDEWSAAWFPIDDVVYLDIAAHAVMPRVAVAAAESSIEANKFPHHLDDAGFFEVPNALRASIATLIGGSAHEVALTTGASTGLQAIAHHIDWRPGDGIVIGGGDFPLHHAVWNPMEARAGAQLTVVAPRDGVIAADDVIAAITPRTRVVSLSHARFDTGALLDAPRIAAACRASGAWFVLDASQSCGAVPIDVGAFGADVLVSAGYKWLLGPYGTGFLWVKDARLDQLLPGPFYWTAQDTTDFASLQFDGPKPSRDAKRWDAAESAMQLNLNLAAFRASVDLVVRMGPERVLHHGRHLIETLFQRLPPHCAPAGPGASEERAAFGSFTAGSAEDTAALYRRLRAEHFIVSLRQGKIRVAPHLFNSVRQIGMLAEAVQRSVA